MIGVIRFWTQPCGAYRDFQLVFTILTLNFALPSLVYALAPELAVAQFCSINELLGGAPYTFPEAGSRLWRYLAVANVATLALMCAMLQLDLRRHMVVLVPLTFMKILAATLWLCGWLAAPEFPVLLAAAALDYVTSGAFVFFARRARRGIDAVAPATLVPTPLGERRP